MNIDKAGALMFAWKNAEELEYAVKLMLAGYELVHKGKFEFGPDDIPESEQHYGQHLPGIAARHLALAGLIRPIEGNYPEKGIWQGRRKSKRKSRNGAKTPVYSIVSMGRAKSFLERYKCEVPTGQLKLVM